jgi:hypothetical protein
MDQYLPINRKLVRLWRCLINSSVKDQVVLVWAAQFSLQILYKINGNLTLYLAERPCKTVMIVMIFS